MKGEHYTVIRCPRNTPKTSEKFIVTDWHIVSELSHCH